MTVLDRPLSRPKPPPGLRRKQRNRVALNVAAILFCVLWAFPVYWMFDTAFKPYGKILSPTPGFLPIPFSVGNFVDAVHKPLFSTYLINSLIVTDSVVVLSIIVAFFAATALTRFRFFGRRGFLIGVLMVQMVPQPALLIPIFLSLRSVHLLNTLMGLTLRTSPSCCPSPSGRCAASCTACRSNWRRPRWSTERAG